MDDDHVHDRKQDLSVLVVNMMVIDNCVQSKVSSIRVHGRCAEMVFQLKPGKRMHVCHFARS